MIYTHEVHNSQDFNPYHSFISQRPLPSSQRPIYSSVMRDVVLCFTGFKSKEDLHHLCLLAHLMGASIRKDMVAGVTHIVAHAVSGSKYKVHACVHS